MNMKRIRNMVMLGAWLILSLAPALAAEATSADRPTADPDAFGGLIKSLNGPLAAETLAMGLAGKTHCGEAGECNYTDCPDPGCDPGAAKSCSCTKNGECGFFEKHTTYDCECQCGAPPQPPPPGPICVHTPAGNVCTKGSDPKARLGPPVSHTDKFT